MPWEVEVAEVVPAQAQAHSFAPVSKNFLSLQVYIQLNHHLAQMGPRESRWLIMAMVLTFPWLTLPTLFPGVWPQPPADMPPANGLRILAGRFLNNP